MCTINNPTENDYDAVRNAVPDKLEYVTFNLEVGKNGTPHLQVFARAKNQLRTKSWQAALGGRCGEIQEVRSKDDARDYAQGYETKSNREKRKEGSQEGEPLYEEYGTYTQQGKRTDLHDAIDKVQNGMPMTELIEEMPGTVSRAYKMLRDYAQEKKFQTAREMVLAEYENIEWREWQQDVLDLIAEKPDGRKVHWYHEDTEDVGKTHLRKYLQAKNTAYCPDVTKPADIYFGYNLQPVIIFDIPRGKTEHMDHLYAVIESFINGAIFVGKYESKSLVFPAPHVIVFSNEPPKQEIDGKPTLSYDRWDIHHIAHVRITKKRKMNEGAAQ